MAVPPLPPPHPRKISYVLPPVSSLPPTLSLPPSGISRRGHTGPLYSQRAPPPLDDSLLSDRSPTKLGRLAQQQGGHPRHRLAVQALALDLSTALSSGGSGKNSEGETEPGGILYTGARDGLVCSWELGLPTKRRKRRYGRSFAQEEGYDSESSGSDGEVQQSFRSETSDPLDLDDLGTRTVSVGSRRKLGARTSSGDARRGAKVEDQELIPLEERWEVDDERVKSMVPPSAKFRQCIQSHTDWVNDIVLCDYNRTLISASSDSLLLAWNPHSSHDEQVTPKQIGRHGDYVRCLAGAREANWVASGGFDRKIKLWDVGEGRSKAVVELATAPASVYSISATPCGSLLAAGSPERVVRVWDPRSRRQVARLSGHTDNVRSVLLGDTGKWLLSASSDSTVKLWSLAAQRCLHTFSHHSASVWSLFSQHPSLEIFYSGDRSGNICKIDLEGTGDPSEGECIVLARDGPDESGEHGGCEGITQLVAQDDSWVWSASGSSSVRRWRDIVPRSRRAGPISLRSKHEFGIDTILQEAETDDSLPSPPDDTPPIVEGVATSTWTDKDRSGTQSVTFLEGLTSSLSRTTSTPTPRLAASPSATPQFNTGRPSSLRTRPSATQAPALRAFRTPLETMGFPPSSTLFSSSPTTATEMGSATLFEIPYDSLVPLTSPDDPYFAPTFSTRARDPETATIYSTISLVSTSQAFASRPSMSTSPPSYRRPHSVTEPTPDTETHATNIARREYLEREAASEATPLRSAPEDVILGGHGLMRCELLNDRRHVLSIDTQGEVALWDIVEGRCLGVFAPDELVPQTRRPSDALSAPSENGSGSGRSTDESRDVLEFVRDRIEGEVAIPTWCTCTTRTGALTVHLEEGRVFDAEVYADEAHLPGNLSHELRFSLGKWVLRHLFNDFIEAESEARSAEPSNARPGPTFISLVDVSRSPTTRQPKTPGMTIALATPALSKALLPDLPPSSLGSSPRASLFDLTPIPQSPSGTPRLRDPLPNFQSPSTPSGTRTPTGPRGEGDYFSLLPAASEPVPSAGASSPLPTPGGTLMGRLRLLGKGPKRQQTGDAADQLSTATLATQEAFVEEKVFRTVEEQQQHRILEAVFAHPVTPCPLSEAPKLNFQENMAIIISEEKADAWSVTYRGLVGTGRSDMHVIEQKAPQWLLDFLIGNRIPAKETVKVAFLVAPWIDAVRAGLPEIPNANARLTANRSLRIAKVAYYIADKLDLHQSSRAPSISGASQDGAAPIVVPAGASAIAGQVAPNDFDLDQIEVLCGDTVLPMSMQLATVRAYYWKSGGDVVLSYRMKQM